MLVGLIYISKLTANEPYCTIVITARNASEVESTSKEIATAHPSIKALGVVADATKLADLKTLVSKVIRYRHEAAFSDRVSDGNRSMQSWEISMC